MALLAGGCGDPGHGPGRPPIASALSPGVAARVGEIEIEATSIGRLAAAQHTDLPHARDVAIRDALLASEARLRGLEVAPDTAFAETASLARRMLYEVRRVAEEQGPVTDEELRKATARHWLDLDRPDGFRTVHAVVRLNDKSGPEKVKRAAEVAEAIHEAVAPLQKLARATTRPKASATEDPVIAAFQEAVNGVPHPSLEVVVEGLPLLAADGRALQPEAPMFDKDFARAAAALTERGDLSPPATSSFGIHVLMLLEKVPGRVVPQEDRRRLVRDEVMDERERTAEGKLLEGLSSSAAVGTNVEAILQTVPFDR